MSEAQVDCAIIGAGAAGIGAARTLLAGARTVRVLEALPRPGGRAWTEHIDGVPCDWGCHWLHSASRNPLRAEADRLGFRYRRAPPQRRLWRGDGWESDAQAAQRLAFRRHGEALLQRCREDLALSDVLPRHALHRPWFEYWVSVLSSVDVERVSVLDYASYADSGEDWPVVDGYGALLARLAEGLPISVSARVDRVAQAGRALRLEGDFGSLRARSVIVTTSTSALAAGCPVFEPALPDWKLEACRQVPLGRANKVVFTLRGEARELPEDVHLLDASRLPGCFGYYLRPHGQPLVIAHSGGRFAEAMEAAGEAATVAAAREGLHTLLGAGAARCLGSGRAVAWGRVPSIRGAYSCALPGQAVRRAALAEPVDERLHFAGEACHPGYFSTAHGAWMSGQRSAAALLAGVLGDRGPAPAPGES